MRPTHRLFSKKAVLYLFFGLLLNVNSFAGNLAISAVTATNTTISFTISMQYCWNDVGVAGSPNNWDAAWVFVKYNDCSGGIPNWQHLNLSSAAVHTVSGGILQVDPTTDGIGVFIRRSVAGSNGAAPITGNVVLTFGAALASSNYQFKVFGIEMVYCPANDFQVGDGASANRFNSIAITAAMQAAGIATASVTLGGTGTTVGTLPSTYPMGTGGLYCMKYNMTTLQMLDFLNTLPYDQQAQHLMAGAPNSAVGAVVGNGTPAISIAASGNSGTVPKTPATFSTATALANPVKNWNLRTYLAYLDWTGLRPMTELEYEKICRGTLVRIPSEYPWGNTLGHGAGPGAATTRTTAGATYYGVLYFGMNNTYSGELIPIVNTTAQAANGGTAFTFTLGNGALDATGLADIAGWPHITNVGGGAGMKSNAWMGNNNVSNRAYYNTMPAGIGLVTRGVRQY